MRFALLSSSLLFVASNYAYALDSSEMEQHLSAGAPLLGTFSQSNDKLAKWMSGFGDDTTIESLSIPGTHDTLTWNVTEDLALVYQTQDIPLFEQFDRGVRFIDLRIYYVNSTIRLVHSTAVLDPNAQLEDIFWGIYHWLDGHPTETILVSVKVDNGNNTAELQQTVYNLITGDGVNDYWVQSNLLPTLGAARHKAILIDRMGFSALTNITSVGINVATGFADNNASFTIDYSGTGQHIAYIEDLYDVNATDLASAVNAKSSAVASHVDLAAGPDTTAQLVWSFASGYSGFLVFPAALAVGNGTTPGVNNKTIDYLASKKGSRFGVVLYDFYGSDARLGPVTLSWDISNTSATYGSPSPTPTTNKSGGALASIPSGPYFSCALFAILSTLVLASFV